MQVVPYDTFKLMSMHLPLRSHKHNTSSPPTASERSKSHKRNTANMMEVVVSDRLGTFNLPHSLLSALATTYSPTSHPAGRRVRVKCEPDDTIGDLKKLIAAQVGTRPDKLKLQKWTIVYRDHITLA